MCAWWPWSAKLKVANGMHVGVCVLSTLMKGLTSKGIQIKGYLSICQELDHFFFLRGRLRPWSHHGVRRHLGQITSLVVIHLGPRAIRTEQLVVSLVETGCPSIGVASTSVIADSDVLDEGYISATFNQTPIKFAKGETEKLPIERVHFLFEYTL